MDKARQILLHKANITLSIFATLFMMSACASYTTVYANIRNVPWFIYKIVDKMVMKARVYIGLRGKVTAYFDDYENEMSTMSEEKLWSVIYEEYKCDTEAAHKQAAMSHTCMQAQNCNTAGQVVVAFIIIAWMCAIVSGAASYLRIGSDGYMKKLIALICSCAAFVSSIIAFAGFGSCLQWFNILSDRKLLRFDYYFPGAGGILSILSFLMFFAVFVINWIIPTSVAKKEEENSKESGLASQDVESSPRTVADEDSGVDVVPSSA